MFADQKHLKVGGTVNLGLLWHVTGIVESGKLSHLFADIGYLQDQYSETGHISVIYVKVDNPANTEVVIDELKKRLARSIRFCRWRSLCPWCRWTAFRY